MPDAGGDVERAQGGTTNGDATASVLADRYRVDFEKALPELIAPGTSAFAVDDLQGAPRNLFARVLDSGTFARTELLAPLRMHKDSQIIRPLEWGVIPCPPRKRNVYAVVFERPSGPVLSTPGATTLVPIPVNDLTSRVLAPAAQALAQLNRRGLTHGAIRPDNLYASGSASGHVLVGECVTSPPHTAQPTAFLTIELGMTPPLGRGPGTAADDMYALGVTVLALALGRMPLANLSDDEIVQVKLARGSFIALLAGERLPFGLREVLRGLLSDNTKERWGFGQIEQWLGGGMIKALHDSHAGRMDRPMVFRGLEHWGFRDLAHAFGQEWRSAASTVLEEGFAKWATRGVGDADLAEDIRKTLKAARTESASSTTPDARLVTHVCSILDPDGPLRYRSVVAMPDGLGPLLAAAMRDNVRDQVSDICDLLAKGVAIDWITWRADGDNSDLALALKPYKELQQLLRHNGPGYGVERCLYELNPGLPCQSPAVEAYHVDTLADLLPTLESVVARTGRLPAVFDRHFAAFIANRAKRNLDRDFAAMDQTRGDVVLSKLGMVKLFAWLQTEYGPSSLPQLSTWLADDLKDAADRFASRTLRAEVRRRLAAAAPNGDLNAIYNALCDRALLNRDADGRRAAVHEFVAARRNITELEARDLNEGAESLGGRVAAWVGGAVALASAALVVLN